MADGDDVNLKIARPVLGTYYERDVSFAKISAAVNRLSALGLLRWRIFRGRSRFFRKRASWRF